MGESFQVEFKIESQFPLIHFQYEDGVTVRSSEMKPKLDRYLYKVAPKEISDDMLIDPKNKKNNKNALCYSLRIIPGKEDSICRAESYGLFDELSQVFWPANAKGSQENPNMSRQMRVVESSPTVQIICMNKKLMELIKEYFPDFLIATNFGRMQSKGFGSFIVTERDGEKLSSPEKTHVVEILKANNGGLCRSGRTELCKPDCCYYYSLNSNEHPLACVNNIYYEETGRGRKKRFGSNVKGGAPWIYFKIIGRIVYIVVAKDHQKEFKEKELPKQLSLHILEEKEGQQ